jgi:hypothetical protein
VALGAILGFNIIRPLVYEGQWVPAAIDSKMAL